MTQVEAPARAAATKTRAHKSQNQAAATRPGPEEANFLKGKALAAAMFEQQSFYASSGSMADLIAGHRAEVGELVPQANYSHAYLAALIEQPELLGGFSAAVSSMLCEGFDGGDIPSTTAMISFAACTQPSPSQDYNSRTEPPLFAQVASYGFKTMETPRVWPEPSDDDRAGIKAGEDASYLLYLAIGTLSVHSSPDGGDLLHATRKILELAKVDVDRVEVRNVIRGTTVDELIDNASCALARAVAVLDALMDRATDDITIESVFELTNLAKSKLDDRPRFA